jgi:FixJ family two-component response regulator
VTEAYVLELAPDNTLPPRRAKRGRAEPRPDLPPEVVVVEGEPIAPDMLSDQLSEGGFMVTPVPDGPSCLDLVATRIPSAIVLDMEHPHDIGLDLLRSLKAWHCPSPIVVVSRKADVRLAVEAMKCGALDVFERPLALSDLLACLRKAVKVPTPPRPRPAKLQAFPGRELLTRREREVLAQVAQGASNKEAGRLLSISPRTVEVHRARIMEKLNARNAADLVRIVLSQTR